jgi:hypothetical protein
MNVRRLRTFMEAIYRHHGWPLADSGGDPFLVPEPTRGDELEARTEALAVA